jgi:hypothetical protein
VVQPKQFTVAVAETISLPNSAAASGSIFPFSPGGILQLPTACTLFLEIMNKEDLNRLLDDLILLGVDKRELNFWRAIYDDIEEGQQNELDTNLRAEFEKLSALEQRSLPDQEKETSDTDLVALALEGKEIRLISVTSDGTYRLLDRSQNLLNILYVYSKEIQALEGAVEEFESLINNAQVKESDLQTFFERNPQFILGEQYSAAHSRIVLQRDAAEPLKPDFVLEPADQSRLCDILELKHPLAPAFVLKARRFRFSAGVFEACAQLREYSLYFDEEKNRKAIQSTYGLLAYKPRMFVIIGRLGRVSPIDLRKIELDHPNLNFQTYDGVLAMAKRKLAQLKGWNPR